MLKNICAVLLALGGLNWGVYGLFTFDFIAWICGGAYTLPARVAYTLVGVAAVIYTFLMLAHQNEKT